MSQNKDALYPVEWLIPVVFSSSFKTDCLPQSLSEYFPYEAIKAVDTCPCVMYVLMLTVLPSMTTGHTWLGYTVKHRVYTAISNAGLDRRKKEEFCFLRPFHS